MNYTYEELRAIRKYLIGKQENCSDSKNLQYLQLLLIDIKFKFKAIDNELNSKIESGC